MAASQVYEGGDSVNNDQSLALLSDGSVWGWGNDAFGQLTGHQPSGPRI